MSDNGRPEHAVDDGDVAASRPACMALVPVAQSTEWTGRAHQPSSRPASTFIAQLLAAAEQTRSLRGATAADVQTAYSASRHQAGVAGIRTRQII